MYATGDGTRDAAVARTGRRSVAAASGEDGRRRGRDRHDDGTGSDSDVELGGAAAKGPATAAGPRPCCSVTTVLGSVVAILVAAVLVIAVAPLYAPSAMPGRLAKEVATGSRAPPWCDAVAAGLLTAGAGSVGAAAIARAVELYDAASAAVAAASPKPHYGAMYRSQEYKYWGPQLPSWMVVHACGMASAGTPLRSHLDVGIAYGTLAVLLAQATHNVSAAYGMDMFPILSPQLAAGWNISFDLANVELLPLLPTWRAFDAAIMTESLEHLNFQAPPTLARVRAALRPGAVLWLSTPDGGDPGFRDVANWTALHPPPPIFARGDTLPDVLDTHVYVAAGSAAAAHRDYLPTPHNSGHQPAGMNTDRGRCGRYSPSPALCWTARSVMWSRWGTWWCRRGCHPPPARRQPPCARVTPLPRTLTSARTVNANSRPPHVRPAWQGVCVDCTRTVSTPACLQQCQKTAVQQQPH